MIMDMLFVDMGADDIGVFAFGKPLGKLTAQAVCFLRGDLAGDKGLPQMVGNYIILTAQSAGLLDVLILGKKKFGIRDPAVTLPACNQSAVVRLLRIFGVVQYVADCLSYCAAFTGVQGHQACGCHRVFTSLKAKRPAEADRFALLCSDYYIGGASHFLLDSQIITQEAATEKTIAVIGEKLKFAPPKKEFNASPISIPNIAATKIIITRIKFFNITPISLCRNCKNRVHIVSCIRCSPENIFDVHVVVSRKLHRAAGRARDANCRLNFNRFTISL